MDGTWTIGELAERAAAALLAVEPVQANGRVRDLPNARLIRWYTTIGLVDPPLGRRGRVALYGPRHLLQIVAVKRRQSAGRTIAEIQVELAAATDTMLERIAALPASPHPGAFGTPSADGPAPHPPRPPAPTTGPPRSPAPAADVSHPEVADPTPDTEAEHQTPDTDQAEVTPPSPSPADTSEPASHASTPGPTPSAQEADTPHTDTPRSRFWSTRPGTAPPSVLPAPPPESAASGATSETAPPPPAAPPSSTAPKPTFDIATPSHLQVEVVPTPPAVVQAVRLAPDLTVLLDVASLTPDDVAAIQDAARPLLDELRRRGLISAPPTQLSGRST
ncbi:helix-turn-helix domain-containing protein [Actinomadura hibisca]|uniref:helix-turn-helix domain-containing protein n=1 Tax=Actinomadura hibisca TaxID=68565 RepID=UPI000AB600E7|nr:MerR family transcriptional regulator [Actinomadura hibisca]